MVQLTKSFLALLSLSGAALATVGQIKTDLASLSTTVTSLDTAIGKFPTTGGTLTEALAIHTTTGTLIGGIKTTTVDVTATAAFSVTDGTSILNTIKAIAPNILSALNDIVAKKAAFVALPLGGVPKLIHADLTWLNGNATLMANALIKNCPSSLVADATTVKNNIGAAIETAISAYAAYA